MSYVFLGSDTLKDKQNHSTIKFFDNVGDYGKNNSSISYGEDKHGKYMRWESSMPRGGGFKLEIDKELNEEYTIGVKFSFDQTDGSWRKIIDYKNSTSDTGFYFYDGGHLQFYPSSIVSQKSISNNEVVNFIIVRSKTEFAVYIVKTDGSKEKEFSLTDSTTLSDSKPHVENGKTLLGFFFDDTATSAEATPGGKIYSLAVYDQAVDPNKVIKKLNKIPDKVIYSKNGNDITKSTTVYTVTPNDGTISENTTTEVFKKDGVKPKVEVTEIPAPIRYEKDETKESERKLPNTGTIHSIALFSLGILGTLSGLRLITYKKKED